MKIFFSFLFLITTFCLHGQITFSEEGQLKTLMSRYKNLGKEENMINGWRIKLISTTDRRKMERTKYSFDQYFPQYKSTSNYENPYYSLKVGAFETRFDVEPLLVGVKELFPEAIPFRDRILKTELFE